MEAIIQKRLLALFRPATATATATFFSIRLIAFGLLLLAFSLFWVFAR
jgi:hypothetical protein